MALIETPNLYDSGTAVSRTRGRFAVIGEPIVAVDLINTAAAPGSSVADDLLSADRGAEAWWRIERAYRDAVAPGVRRKPAAGVHRRAGRDVPVRPVAGTPAAPVANPACSMIFIAVNPRRSRCAPGVCGNRVRVARHHRQGPGLDAGPDLMSIAAWWKSG
jgi:hypothetical protein